MELRHLRYLVAVADHGTVSRAAEQMHVTQPGLSRQLRRLEQYLGVDVFDRSAGRLSLTSAGRALVPLARDLLGQAESFRVAATFHAEGRLERLTVGAPTVTLTDVVAPFIATLADEDPTADVLSADGISSVEALTRGADLAIGTARPRPPYRSHPLAVLPVWAYVPQDHAWAARRRVTIAELAGQPLVILPAAFTARQALDDALATTGDTWDSLVEAANGTVAQALAAAGRGVAVVSDDPRYNLVPLPVELPGQGHLSIRLVSVWDSRHTAAPTLEALARRLSTFTRERYGAPAG
ncbi:LysR family transcriptional regulator [Nocardioides glacieisoli]|uniref:LysR family transcriptional regulator n=2 Tax=Nocardioides glacieisoli TaxID=1168730 RepID=A0A4Q2RUH6_9ACTN|nr:LysR family transcriptional regulator [Nocardioides glacieisoli]